MKHRFGDQSQKIEKKQLSEYEPYKLSIHTTSNFNKSDSGSKRLNISRMLENSRKKISMRRASELFQTPNIRPQSTKHIKRNEVIEFDNIKWISIISAYDPSRLKNVSVSKKSCQKFLSLNGQNMKKDSRNMLYFNDLVRNFKSWLNKIQAQYCYIMNKFLHQKESANITLLQLRPKLDEVINQTVHMQENLEDCLKSYQNHEFRQLLNKYSYSLGLCRQVEDIVLSVNKSKNKIVDLYKKFDNDRKIQQKINKVKKQSLNEVKSIICQYEVEIQDQIMNRIQQAINQIAQKSGQAYRKIRGVKHLIQKFKNTEKQSKNMNKIDIETISFMGMVCKEICQEAQNFEQFSSKFLVEGVIINEDLQKIVKKYQQDVTNQKKKAIQLQMKFLNIIFSQTIRKLKDNSKISVVYENADAHNEEYKKILRMIQDIADCIAEQDKRVSLQKLIKQTRTILDRLFDDLRFLKENKKFQQIDTEEGLISILEVNKLIKEYKDKILLVRKKFEMTHRDLQLSQIRIDHIPNDSETQFISLVIGLSKKINNSGVKAKLQKQSCFSPITQGTDLRSMWKQIEKQNILQDITSISNEFLQIQSKNVLQKYFGPLKLENLVFKESIIMVQIKKIALKTKQNNIIPQLTQLLGKRNEWHQKHKKISPQMKRYFERILACTLVKGLKPKDIQQLQNPQQMPFPTKQNDIQGLKNKAKYLQVLFDLIQRSVTQTSKSLRSQRGDQRSDEKVKNRRILKSANTKFNFYITDILQRSITNINNYINSFLKIQDMRKNINNDTYLKKDYFIVFAQKLFTLIFLGSSQKESIKRLLGEFIQVSYQRFLSLTRKTIQEENQWKEKEKRSKLENSTDSKEIPVYLQKIIQVLELYKVKTQHLSEIGKQALETLQKHVQNVENSSEQVDKYLQFNVYAKIIKELVKYCKETDQKIHVILDSKKSPIALVDSTMNVIKQVFPGLKKGKELTENECRDLVLNEAKLGIELKLKKLQNEMNKEIERKEKLKQLKKNHSEMQQEIMDEDVEGVKDDMQEEYPADDVEEIEDNDVQVPDDDMTEQLGEEFQSGLQEEMAEDFEVPQDQTEEQKLQDQAMQDLIEESQKIGQSKGKTKTNPSNTQKKPHDQFDEDEWEKNNKKSTKTKDHIEVQQQKQQEKKQKQVQEKQKQQQQQKSEQSKKEVLKNSIYEVLAFITSLSQLKKLIDFLSLFEQNYFKKFIDWAKIQHYYNNHPTQGSKTEQKEIQKYVKNLEDDGQLKIKDQYKSQPLVFNEIKNLDTIKKLKKDLLLLKNGNWETLSNVLSKNYVSHNILKGKNQSLYVYIHKSAQEFDQFGCIHGYLSKNFQYYERNQFDLKGFAEKCFISKIKDSQEHGYVSVTYEVKSQTSLIENCSEIQQNYQNLKQSIDDFSNGAKDNVNKFDFCLQLYKKALQIKEKVNLDLNWYTEKIKFLQKYGTDESHPLSFMHFVKQNVKIVIKKVKSLESKLYNLSFKCERSNLFECFNEVCELYGEEIHKKIVLSKNEQKFVVLLFDKTTVKNNEQRIKRILGSQPKDNQQKAEKILLTLFFGPQYQQMAQISEERIFSNAHKIDIQSSQLLLDVMSVLRVDHSYISIKNKSFQYFVLKKSKQECISSFFQKITKSIMDSIDVAKLVAEAPFLAPIKELLKPQNSFAYQQVLSKQSLGKLFKETHNNQKLYNQIQISVSQENFMFGKSWVDETVIIMKEIVECFTSGKKQTNKVLENLKKLKPCHYIYYKRFSKEKQSQTSKLWIKHLQSFQSIQQNSKSVMSKNSWILLLNLVQRQFKQQFSHEMNENIMAIKSLLNVSNIQHSLESISNQVRRVFQWIRQKDKLQGKVQFSILTLPQEQQIVYFECNNASGLNEDYFVENFAFLDTVSVQLRELLSHYIVSSMTWVKDGLNIKALNLKKSDKFYELDTQKLSASFISFSEQIVGQQTQKDRRRKLREFVAIFNRIYFLSRTTEEFNFKKESGLLQSLQKEFKKDLGKLKLLYSFNTFLFTFSQNFQKGSTKIEALKRNLTKSLQQNEKIPEAEIQQITQKMDKITTNSKSNSIDSYQPFYSWFYQTVMSVMQMPFYNLITHIERNKATQVEETQLLGVIVTEEWTKPGEVNQELEMLLEQILPYTEHKPIYLRQNDLTVELLKEPAFVTIDSQINGVELSEIISYLNENCQEDQKDPDFVLHLRIDEIHNFKHHHHEQRTLYKTIPLEVFTKQAEQQFNINVTQDTLNVQVEFNIIYAPKNLNLISQDLVVIQSFLPLNGALTDKFEKVYIGKKLKLQKIKSWLYSFYLKTKNQIQVQNKGKYIEQFFTGFPKYFLKTVPEQSKEAMTRITNKMDFQSVLKGNPRAKKVNILYLQQSRQMLQSCKKQLQKYRSKQYEKKPSLQKHYDEDVMNLVERIQSKVHEELVLAQNEIRQKMQVKLKEQAIKRVEQLYQSHNARNDQDDPLKLQLPEKSQPPEQDNPLQQPPSEHLPVDNNQPPKSPQKQIQQIDNLRESNFEEYLMKKIEIGFSSLTQDTIGGLEGEIVARYVEKVKEVGGDVAARLKAKTVQVFKGESLVDEINVNPHRRLMLLYLVVEKYLPSQIRLLLEEK